MIEKEITVGELKELYNSNLYELEIDTPDGFQKIINWWDKGILPMIKIKTQNFETICAENHLIQTDNQQWMLANELDINDLILTRSGIEPVLEIIQLDPQECYDFEINHQNHRYWGDGISSHNSGKSFISSGNIIKNAQDQNVYCVLIDSENALDESWLKNLGVDTSEEKLLKINAAMIDDVAKIINDFVKEYRSSYEDMPFEERPKILFVIDSLGMLLSPTEVNQFQAGEMKGDMGRKAKQLKALVGNCVNMFGDLNIGMVATNHSYASQDQYNPDQILSGGQGFIFASSIVVSMTKLKLKEDEEGNKLSEVVGIRSNCKVVKTRYNKPFEGIQIQIPFESGMNPYSGLFDLFEKKNVLKKEGNRYIYKEKSGTEHKMWRKEYVTNETVDFRGNKIGILDLIMQQWEEPEIILGEENEIDHAELNLENN